MSARQNLHSRAQNAILKNIVEDFKENHATWAKDPNIRAKILNSAFFKPANAVLIAGALLAAGCTSLLVLPVLALTSPLWLALGALAPLALGTLAEAAYLYFAVNNEKSHAAVVAEMLRPQVKFNPNVIKNGELRAKIDKALEYWSLIDDAVQQVTDGPLRTRLEHTTREATQWLQAVFNLAQQIDGLYQNDVIGRDLKAVPKAIKDLQARLALEDSPQVQQQLQETIANNERQLRTLQSLEDQMEKANYQLDSTISSLGTIYSQLLLVGSKDESGSRVARLQDEISEQVHRLEDLSEAMDEVYEVSY